MGWNANGPARDRTGRCVPVALVLAALASPALAGGKPGLLRGAGAVEPPEQYRDYCQRYGHKDPGCHARWGGSLPLGREDTVPRHALPMAVHWHRQVVGSVTARPDKGDRWSVAANGGQGMSGDCDDVVVTTIAHLVRRGLPRAALRATIVRLPGDEGHHLILAVRTQEGEVFLDDRSRWPLSVADALERGYGFVAQEVPGEPHWQRVRVDGGGTVAGAG